MLLVIALLAINLVGGMLCRTLAGTIAAIAALITVTNGRRAATALADHGKSLSKLPAAWDRPVTSQQRRMLRNGMKAAIDNAQLTSLLPSTTMRAQRIARAFRG